MDEVNVPNGYTKTIQRDANTITIYNTKTADTPIPQTGGAAPSLLPTLALGTGLGICGLFKQKRRR